MDKNLVDHELKEDRKRQPERIEEHRSNCDVGKEPPLPQHFGYEPAQPEGPVALRWGTLALEQNDLSGPPGAEAVRIDQQVLSRPLGQRIKDRYSVAFRAGADHEDPVEVRELDKSRIGLAELAYRLPIELRRAGAKARIMSHAEQEIGRDASLVDGIGVPQPIRRQIDTVMGSDP
ncbi:hypothetical protein BwSH20_52020 [Bradyrhizobium ottawaense]|nr:hypothetical protein SG09_47550 [Bradyrhizobium ottawaense]BBO13451.1 hypothetical protein TM102_49210 [Bradyrhizobium sp. TM102]GMO21322.1 hypothetical protein BwSH14_16210 [Bradyrhizobium ottawaense]GMO26489.1 hypothetical protein BwSF21_25070 [Bradyrhizobium ottawaense]GMO35932.1 hypothetical protein BwSF12_35840 [Bradyrhizobium ottawaense]